MKKEIIKTKVTKSEFAKICDFIKDWDDLTLSMIEDFIKELEKKISSLENDLDKIKEGIALELHYIEKDRRIRVENIRLIEEEIKNLRDQIGRFSGEERKEYRKRIRKMSDNLESQKHTYILCFDEVENCQKRLIKYEDQINREIKDNQKKAMVFHKIKDTFIELWPESPRQPTSPRSKLEASPLRRPNSFQRLLKSSPASKSFPSGSVSLPASPRRKSNPSSSSSTSPVLNSRNGLRRSCYSPMNSPQVSQREENS